MKPEYIRDIHSNYMKLSCEWQKELEYETEIIKQNKIEGLLPCKISQMDNRQVYAYEISNLQSMGRYYAQRDLGEEELMEILRSVDEILYHLRPYLLEVNHLILEPDYIYLDVDNNQQFFCFYPGYAGDIQDAMRNLSEYFIEKLNHNDPGAVQLGYTFFRKSREDNFNLSRLIQSMPDIPKEAEEENPLEKTDIAQMEPETTFAMDNQVSAEIPLPAIAPAEQFFPEINKPKKKGSLFSFRGKGEKQKKEKKEHQRKSPLPVYAVEDSFFQGASGPAMAYAVHEDTGSEGYQTATDFIQAPKLVAVDNAIRPHQFILDQVPYIIGTLSYAVDGLLDYEDIGRFHARIQKNNEGYVLIDLNTQSGTSLNQVPCKASVEYPLHNGDLISFSKYTYRFEE